MVETPHQLFFASKMVVRKKIDLPSVLHRLYYDPESPVAFAGIQQLYREAKRIHPKLVRKQDVVDWIQEQSTYTLHKPIKRKFRRSRTIVSTMDEQWQGDLADVSSMKDWNDKNTFLLCVIDVFSKYAWVEPLKNKTSKEMIRGFGAILKRAKGRKPRRFQTDKGKEFLNKEFQKMLKEEDIHFFTTHNTETKASIVERFQRTLKGRMWKYFTHQKTRRYVEVLPRLVKGYNSTKHSTIGRAPRDVTHQNVLDVWLYAYAPQRVKAKKPIYKVGDRVRISKAKHTFEKGYLPNWTTELFTIKRRVVGRVPYAYVVQDDHGEELEGTFYEAELQKVIKRDDVYEVEDILKTRKRKVGKKRIEEVLVRWKGYPPSFDSWIPKKDMIR